VTQSNNSPVGARSPAKPRTTKKNDLTTQAQGGYDGSACQHIWSSPAWYAYQVGQYLRSSGRTAPRDVRMGRGNRIHANDLLFKFTHQDGQGISFERIQ